ncbi:MAG TPA: IS110 family transposase [Acidobacteriota bacterium]|nr:IS110 family transposase [Acidobacteriota bacterium]
MEQGGKSSAPGPGAGGRGPGLAGHGLPGQTDRKDVLGYEADVRRGPRARLLTTIPGVGYYIALLLVVEIGDMNRFPDSESLCSYGGLVPTVWQSGDSTHHGGHNPRGVGVAQVGADPGGAQPPAA